MKNNKAFNRKSIQKKYYNNPSNTSTFKTQKKKLCSASMKKMVHFNEIVEVGYTHAAEEYDRTSIVASKLTKEDILENINIFVKKFRMETMEATRQRAIEESNQSSPVFTNVMPSSPIMDDMNLAVYASTSIGNSSLLTEVLAVPPSIISSPVLTPRTNDDEMITQKQREIEYMIYQKQQMENNYLEALHYQQALQVLAQQQQNFDLWRLYSQPQQTFIESDLYLQPSNSNYYANINNVSPSMALWYAQDKAMYPAEYEPVQLMTQMEVM